MLITDIAGIVHNMKRDLWLILYSCHVSADMKLSKRRQPFVPYALRNHTGCTLWFATLTTTPTRSEELTLQYSTKFYILGKYIVVLLCPQSGAISQQ